MLVLSSHRQREEKRKRKEERGTEPAHEPAPAGCQWSLARLYSSTNARERG